MNIFQRIILILGTILFMIFVWSSRTLDLLMAIKVISLLVGILIIFYAFKDIKKRKITIEGLEEGKAIIDKKVLTELMETTVRTKMELLESLEREKIRDKYLERIEKKID